MARWLNSPRARTAAMVVVPGTAAVYLAFRGGGTAAGLAALAAIGCLAALLLRAAPGSLDARVASIGAAAAFMALPGLMTVYFAFNAGGFFPETPAFVAVVLILILVVRVTTAENPFAGFSWPLAVAAGALGLFCLWTLLSGTWSDAPARALIEFDRAFVYLLALVLFGSVPRSSGSLRWLLRGVALGFVVVATAGLLTRTLPDVFPTEPSLSPGRLGYPITYWNTLGILGSLGAVLCLHLSSSLREPRVVRVAAAAALPVLGATVLLTFSRGAIVAGFLGLAAYAVLGRPRGLPSALIAAGPLAALAVKLAYDATLLAGDKPTSAAAIEQGHDLAIAVAACSLGAAIVRVALLPLDRRLRSLEVPHRTSRAAWGTLVAVLLVGLVVLDVPDHLGTQYERFVDTEKVEGVQTRDRLTDPANTGRIDHWNVALDGFRTAELRGLGAGTYGLYWMANRPRTNKLVVDDAHSLYVEVLEELGLVGAVLLIVALGMVLAALAPVRRGRDRPLYAALASAAIAWAVHAGVDWDWETPAVTAWIFCIGGTALASRDVPHRDPLGPTSGARVLIGAVILAGALAPSLVLVSQRQLDDAAEAFERGDCVAATDRASASIRTLEIRPEPYEVLGFCAVRQGFDNLGVEALERAVERDPDNWEFRYAHAVVRGSAGLDPRPEAQAALRLNPHDPLTKSLVRYVDTSSRRRWMTRTRRIAENERLSVVR